MPGEYDAISPTRETVICGLTHPAVGLDEPNRSKITPSR